MSTAVVDIDLERLPSALTDLDRFGQALVLFHLRGRPVAQVVLPVVAGRIEGTELRNAGARVAEASLREHWLHEFLEWDPAADLAAPAQRTATVAVCTRDRTEDLRRCLNSLIHLPDDGQEVLVVDNAPSTDASRDLVKRIDYRGIRYVTEQRPGLDAARNRALREARGEIVAFTDDDAVVDERWLRAMVAAFDDPMVECVAGLVMPFELETPAQEWFERFSPFGRGFRRIVFDGTKHDPLSVGPVGLGPAWR